MAQFYIELTNYELTDLFKNGSTNQKEFIHTAIKAAAVSEVFDLIEELINEKVLTGWNGQDPYDLREAINGGLIFLTDKEEAEELDYNNFLKYEVKNDLFLIIE